MKIFYAIQATGNGHISRAMELLPHLEQYGTVDFFLSGSNSSLDFPLPVKYRSKGCGLFYNSKGGLDYLRIMNHLNPVRLWQEIRDLPVEKYDLVINDYESITSASCAHKRIPSILFGHQASFQSALTPRPLKKQPVSELILKNYARGSRYVGLHFQRYDDFIFPPIIKKEILQANPSDKGHITVYLPAFGEQQLESIFKELRGHSFEIFSHKTKQQHRSGNIQFRPVASGTFNESLINCSGIITGSGFETPAEAIYLGKKLMTIPCKGQYEQQCNAEALKQMGISCPGTIDQDFKILFDEWIQRPASLSPGWSHSIQQSLNYLFDLYHELKSERMGKEKLFPA